MTMHNFKQDILEAAGGEPIEAIVVSKVKENNYHSIWSLRDEPCEVEQWEDVAELLDYTYDTGYGGVECHAITAWTPTRVLFVGCYDGSSWVQSVPRNPIKHVPITVGGG